MTQLLKTVEIVDMGIDKEKKRRDFYALAAEKFTEPKLKELFSKLRDWEESHITRFTEIRAAVKDYETKESFSGERSEYIETLLNDRLYAEVTPEKFAAAVKTPQDAIRSGMSFEKDAILFFTELLPFVDQRMTGTITELIKEEREHLVYLSRLKNELAKD